MTDSQAKIEISILKKPLYEISNDGIIKTKNKKFDKNNETWEYISNSLRQKSDMNDMDNKFYAYEIDLYEKKINRNIKTGIY